MKAYIKLISILVIPLVVVSYFALSPTATPTINYTFEKADYSQLKELFVSTDTDSVKTDTIIAPKEIVLDTIPQRIMFLGDSMVEGLQLRMSDYCDANNHELSSVLWYSSSTKIYAETDTLTHFLRQIKPSFVVICLGSNEQFVRDLDKRDVYIKDILSKVGDIPYVWVSPPSWKQDTGINELIKKNVGEKRYFDSTKLEYVRGKDHVHPTFTSAEMWMDSIAVWMQGKQTAHPIIMEKPTEKGKRKFDRHVLQPLR